MTVTIAAPVTKAPASVETLTSVAWVNAVGISDDGARIVGATYIHDYENKANIFGKYVTFVYDSAAKKVTWSEPVYGWDGLFAVGISGDGSVAASGGIVTPARTDKLINGPDQTTGVVTVFDAASGKTLFHSPTHLKDPVAGRVNVISLSRAGDVVAAAAAQLYVLVKSATGYTPIASAVPAGDPDLQKALGRVAAVAVHPSGQWLAACNDAGQLLVAKISGGAVTRTFLLKVKDEPIDRANPSATAPVRFNSVAISGDADAFVSGGSDVVYRGTLSDVVNGVAPKRYDAWDPAAPVPPAGGPGTPRAQPNVRWTAISGDGAAFAAVANREMGPSKTNPGGQLLLFNAGSATPVKRPITRNPNGVSMDRKGEVIAVSDGFPVGTLSAFYRFDFEGNELWRSQTPNMNWPVAVSANGALIAGGGDDGRIYVFLP